MVLAWSAMARVMAHPGLHRAPPGEANGALLRASAGRLRDRAVFGLDFVWSPSLYGHLKGTALNRRASQS